jgi:hypothetical protein
LKFPQIGKTNHNKAKQKNPKQNKVKQIRKKIKNQSKPNRFAAPINWQTPLIFLLPEAGDLQESFIMLITS